MSRAVPWTPCIGAQASIGNTPAMSFIAAARLWWFIVVQKTNLDKADWPMRVDRERTNAQWVMNRWFSLWTIGQRESNGIYPSLSNSSRRHSRLNLATACLSACYSHPWYETRKIDLVFIPRATPIGCWLSTREKQPFIGFMSVFSRRGCSWHRRMETRSDRLSVFVFFT